MTDRFLIDQGNAKMLGVCAGFARWTGMDPTLTRVAAVLLGLCVGPLVLVAYIVAGLVAERG